MSTEERALLRSHDLGRDATYDVDDALSLAGGWSRYQAKLMMQSGIAMAVLSSHMLVPIFLVPLLHEAWDLSPVARGLISTTFFAGYMCGVFFWAGMSDSRGRRPAILASFTLGNAAGIASFLAPGIWSFLFLRFLCGVGIAGAKNGLFLLATEFATPDARAQVGAQVSYAWLAGLLFLVCVARLLRDLRPWRCLVLIYVPGVIVQIILPNLLPESPRYHLVSGQSDQALLSMLQVFRVNGVPPPDNFSLRPPPLSPVPVQLAADHSGRRRPSTSFDQLWSRSTRGRTLVLGLCQGSCTMVYYALCFDTRFNGQAGGLYLGALLGALIELPAYIILAPMTNRLGRKLSFSTFLALTTVCLFSLHLVSSSTSAGQSTSSGHSNGEADFDWLACILVLGGRFASVAAINVAYIAAAEIFPTSCRNSGIGWGTGCGRLGAMAAPAVMLGAANPLLLFALLSLVAAFLVWLLPESVGLALSDVHVAPGLAGRAHIHGVEPMHDGREKLNHGSHIIRAREACK